MCRDRDGGGILLTQKVSCAASAPASPKQGEARGTIRPCGGAGGARRCRVFASRHGKQWATRRRGIAWNSRPQFSHRKAPDPPDSTQTPICSVLPVMRPGIIPIRPFSMPGRAWSGTHEKPGPPLPSSGRDSATVAAPSESGRRTIAGAGPLSSRGPVRPLTPPGCAPESARAQTRPGPQKCER